MATKLAKRVERETPDGKYVVTLTVEGIMLREKGRRLAVGPLDYEVLYLQGVRAKVQRDQEQRPKRRKKVSRGLLSF